MVGKLSTKWAAEDDAILIRMAEEGATADQIARRLRRSAGAIKGRAAKFNLTLFYRGKTKRSLPPRDEPQDSLGS